MGKGTLFVAAQGIETAIDGGLALDGLSLLSNYDILLIRAISRAIVSALSSSSRVSVLAVETLSSGLLKKEKERRLNLFLVLVGAWSSILLILAIYQVLTLFFGSSPERLNPCVSLILFQRFVLSMMEEKDLDDYFPKDWNCSSCEYLNFAYRGKCGKCGEEKGSELEEKK